MPAIPSACTVALGSRSRARAAAATAENTPGVAPECQPCVMCCGAALQARVARVVYGAADPKAGGVQSLYRLLDDERLNHRAVAVGGVLADESAVLLRRFFETRRRVRGGVAEPG